jgi:hypothetical protein
MPVGVRILEPDQDVPGSGQTSPWAVTHQRWLSRSHSTPRSLSTDQRAELSTEQGRKFVMPVFGNAARVVPVDAIDPFAATLEVRESETALA